MADEIKETKPEEKPTGGDASGGKVTMELLGEQLARLNSGPSAPVPTTEKPAAAEAGPKDAATPAVAVPAADPKEQARIERRKQTVKSLGWTDEDVAELGPKANRVLDDFALAHDRVTGRIGGKFSAVNAENEKLRQENTELRAKAVGKPAGEDSPPDDKTDLPTTDDIEFAPEKALAKFQATLAAERREREKLAAEIRAIREGGGVKAVAGDDDEAFFTSLDEDGRAVYGTGPTEQLAADGPELAARGRLRNHATAYARTMEQLGERVSMAEAMRRMSLTDDSVRAAADKRALEELRRNNRTRVAQAEQRPDRARAGATEVTRTEKLWSNLDKSLARMGVS